MQELDLQIDHWPLKGGAFDSLGDSQDLEPLAHEPGHSDAYGDATSQPHHPGPEAPQQHLSDETQAVRNTKAGRVRNRNNELNRRAQRRLREGKFNNQFATRAMCSVTDGTGLRQ